MSRPSSEASLIELTRAVSPSFSASEISPAAQPICMKVKPPSSMGT